MPKASITVASGIADGELSPTVAQLKVVDESCIKSRIKLLGPPEKSQLRSIIADLKGTIVSASDLLKGRQGRIRAQIVRLQDELDSLDSGQNTLSDFYRLMSDAIGSCSEAEQAATKIKKSSDRVLQQANELNYRIAIAKIQEGRLNGQIQDTNSTLGVLDRINLIIG